MTDNRHVQEWVILRRFAQLHGDQLYHGVPSPHRVTAPRKRRMIGRLAEGALPLEEVDRLVHSAPRSDERLAHLREVYAGSQNLIALVRLKLWSHYDVILVEQGYGGVYVHSYELAKSFRRRGLRVLVLSPEDPLFETKRHVDDVTLRRMQELVPNIDYFSYYHLLRGLVANLTTDLLLIAHRSQSLLLFDLIKDRNTVIYCDGFLDGGFCVARESKMRMTKKLRRRVLAELGFLVASSGRGFFSIYGGPGMNRYMLAAGYHALKSARENWFWGSLQHSQFISSMPELENSSRFVLPFTRPSMFKPAKQRRSKVALFTTTMHNIDKKGFPELVELMRRIPELRVRCVVRQPHCLPEYPSEFESRLNPGSTSKDEMIALYHTVWCNIRTSREESSPLSILESMTCGVPQIVSPSVADQIPIIEDGVTGYVVDPDDPDRLEACVRRLWRGRSLRDAMGSEARRRARQLSLGSRAHLFGNLLRSFPRPAVG